MSTGRDQRRKGRKRRGAPRTERQCAAATFAELGKPGIIMGTDAEFTFTDPVTGKKTVVRDFKSGWDPGHVS